MKKCLLSLFIVAACLVLAGCILEEEPSLPAGQKDGTFFVTYKIPAGGHSALQSSYQPLNVNQIKFKARFDNSAIYETSIATNQGDINKLYGMSDCATDHQKNSARFGWRWFGNALEIWAYTYANGMRKFALVGTVSVNSINTYEIHFTETNYIFKLNNTEVVLPRYCKSVAQGYKLYPYFGGDEVAPHDVTIDIEDIK